MSSEAYFFNRVSFLRHPKEIEFLRHPDFQIPLYLQPMSKSTVESSITKQNLRLTPSGWKDTVIRKFYFFDKDSIPVTLKFPAYQDNAKIMFITINSRLKIRHPFDVITKQPIFKSTICWHIFKYRFNGKLQTTWQQLLWKKNDKRHQRLFFTLNVYVKHLLWDP